MQNELPAHTSCHLIAATKPVVSYNSTMDFQPGTEKDIEDNHANKDFTHFEPVDSQRVQNAIEEAGTNACGIMGIDIWILNDKDGRLYHFGEGINWINPIYGRQLKDEASQGDAEHKERLEILDRLVDTARADYYYPIPQPSGVGLAGNFWQHFGDMAGSAAYFHEPLVWREVRAFTSDPDQMPYERMSAVEKVFGKCTGVPFNIFGESKGVVIFYARRNASENIINTPVNSNFLRMATYNVGSALAMSRVRIRSMQSRKNLARRLFVRARVGFTAAIFIQRSLREKSMNQKITDYTNIGLERKSCFHNFQLAAISLVLYTKNKARNLKSKTLRPPDIKPPPPATFFVSTWSFVGCFAILMTLFGLQNLALHVSSGNLGLILPPFGALMALQFSLTAAPASQPRNSIFGFIISISVVMMNKAVFRHLVDLPQWFHASLGTSLAIFSMQKCGLVHPPAGAAAFVFALSSKDFTSDCLHALVFLLADIMAISLAVFFNNLSDTRQYPMYWRFNPFAS